MDLRTSPQTGDRHDTRDRIVTTAARLMQRQGYQSMSLKQIGTEAKVSAGSIYHFFPGGKERIAVDAVRHAGEEFATFLAAAMAVEGPAADVIEKCARTLAVHLEESGWMDGCPLTATGLETAGRSPAIQDAVAKAFQHWSDIVERRLVADGIETGTAADLAATVVNALEGAEVAAQISRDPRPLHLAGKHLATLVSAYSRS